MRCDVCHRCCRCSLLLIVLLLFALLLFDVAVDVVCLFELHCTACEQGLLPEYKLITKVNTARANMDATLALLTGHPIHQSINQSIYPSSSSSITTLTSSSSLSLVVVRLP